MNICPEKVKQWKNIDVRIVQSYFYKAKSATEKIDKFIYSWIVINHFYAIWSEISPSPDWKNNHGKIRAPSERCEVRYFAISPAVQSIWEIFKMNDAIKRLYIELPLFDRLGREAPNVEAKKYSATELCAPDLFEVLYQLRCDILHGSRNTKGSVENESMLAFAAVASCTLCEYIKRSIEK